MVYKINRQLLSKMLSSLIASPVSSYDFLLKGAGLSPKLLTYLKHNNHMQDKKPVLKEQKNEYYDNSVKG